MGLRDILHAATPGKWFAGQDGQVVFVCTDDDRSDIAAVRDELTRTVDLRVSQEVLRNMTTHRLEHPRRVAEAADNGNPWEWEHAYPQRITRVGDVVVVAECFEHPDFPSRFAEFIATFDPPTVLRLLGAIEDAAVVIERMANGASREQCSPELDRVIALLADSEATT